jgi:hypothetical protein
MSSKTKISKIIHPITLTFIDDESNNKHLIMPKGLTNNIEDQKFFSKHDTSIDNADYKSLFFSDDYFFTAIFNANAFSDKVKLMHDIIKSNYSKQTTGYMLTRMIKTIKHANDKNIEDLIKIYIEYYKKYDNKTMSYSELYDEVKKML